ncbi:MAG: hypothetical protein LBR71_04440 [Synergistaceae bacterium]|jgi:hypothetical protein|nr:hypothetical protein [Synergistaceae bacterium]
MKRIFLVVVMGLLASSGMAWAAEESLGAGSGSVVIQKDRNLLDWTQDYIESTGTAVAPTGTKGAQAKALARRGAEVDLQRNLLEFMAGVQIDARTTMDDFMANDRVRTEVHGIIKNVELLGGEWDGEAYTVSGRIRLTRLRNVVVANISPNPVAVAIVEEEKKIPPAKKTAGKFTGLLIDARHLPLIPSMTFNVFDTKGRAVYSIEFTDRQHYLQSGLCAYFNNIEYAKGDLHVGTNPIVAKAVRLSAGNVDIVISDGDAAKARGSSYDFRRECKVIIVSR